MFWIAEDSFHEGELLCFSFFSECAGTLVHPKLVLTAGHCLVTYYEFFPTQEDMQNNVRIYTGVGKNEGKVIAQHEGETFRLHEKYYQKGSGFVDVGYILLKEPIPIDEKSLPWILQNEVDTPKVSKDKAVHIIGYGEQGGKSVGEKYEVESPTLAVSWSDQTAIAGRVNHGIRKGDSGGGLYFSLPQDDSGYEQYLLLGILSMGTSLEYGEGQYALLAHILPWLEEETGLDLKILNRR